MAGPQLRSDSGRCAAQWPGLVLYPQGEVQARYGKARQGIRKVSVDKAARGEAEEGLIRGGQGGYRYAMPMQDGRRADRTVVYRWDESRERGRRTEKNNVVRAVDQGRPLTLMQRSSS